MLQHLFVDAARTFPTYSIWKLDAHCLNPGRKGQNPTNDASKASERGPGKKGDNLMYYTTEAAITLLVTTYLNRNFDAKVQEGTLRAVKVIGRD